MGASGLIATRVRWTDWRRYRQNGVNPNHQVLPLGRTGGEFVSGELKFPDRKESGTIRRRLRLEEHRRGARYCNNKARA